MNKPALCYGLRTAPDIVRVAHIAHQAHRGEKDKRGRPYFWHLCFVARQMPTDALYQVALLHDVFEDTEMTALALRRLGIAPAMIALVDALTRRPRQPYFLYVRRLRKKTPAQAVKRADLLHNSDRRRLRQPWRRDFARLRRYRRSMRMLNAMFKNNRDGYV